jgi:hypothetical protein|nr:RNA ligase family protein [Neorhizobium tomejilense]
MKGGRILLTRDQFREAVFKRDRGCCVNCGEPGVDAHHIIDRKLFNDGGYYLDNGALVCNPCHILAETTELSVETILSKAGIDAPVYPGHIPLTEKIDKWGNQVLPNGSRMRGEMFDNEEAQKALARGGKLDLFTDLRKYPRTYHFGWSDGVQSDDKMLRSTTSMQGRRIIGTLKMDGENTTLYRDHMHARSLDSKHNFTRDEVKAFWSMIQNDIPERWRVCGENMWAVHSIEYERLAHVFYGFSVWNDRNVALPWDEGQDNTMEWFDLLGIQPVEVVYDGIFDEAAMRRIAREVMDAGHEGMVFRVADAIPYRDFPELAGKAVREGHVQTDQHWLHSAIRRNGFVKPGDSAPALFRL